MLTNGVQRLSPATAPFLFPGSDSVGAITCFQLSFTVGNMRRITWVLFLLLAYSTVSVFVVAQANSTSDKVREALSYEERGAYPEAEQSWQAITAASPQQADAWAHLGLVQALEGKYPEAVSAYRKGLELGSKLPGLQLDLGLALFKQQKLDEAIPALKAAVAEAPTNTKASLLLAMSYYGTAKYAEAIPYLQSAVTSAPTNIQLRTALAQSCLWAAQYLCTLEQYKQILLLNPDSAQADILAGEALDGMGKPDEATAQFRAAEKASPHEPGVHFGLGYLLWKQHLFDDAEQEFKLAMADDPANVQALTYLGDIAIKRNDEPAAMNYLTQAAALPRAIRLTYFDLGILNASHGQNKEAETNFLRAIEMDPTQADAHYHLARLYASTGRQKEAQVEFAKVRDLHQKVDETLAQKMSAAGK
jgi:tetratricopeptide (TPR) repeat protein